MKAMPTDYEQIFNLSQIKDWKMFKFIKRVVEIEGFYSCIYEDKKTVIIA